MGKNNLRHVDGTKIRRQYFTVPLIIFYLITLAVPYFVFVILLG